MYNTRSRSAPGRHMYKYNMLITNAIKTVENNNKINKKKKIKI